MKPFLAALLVLAWNIAQADPTFTFTHVGGGETGSLTKNAEGSYTLIGGGNDIWDVSDEFDFAQTQVSGDFDVAVRVQSLEFTATWTKAGIMARETLAGDSRMAWNRVTPDDSQLAQGLDGANDTRFAYRTGKTSGGNAGANDGQHEEGSGAPEYPNAWLRLQRIGNVVTAFASTDGVNWRQQGSQQDTATWKDGIPLANTVYLGLAVSRHSGADPLATAEFRDLQAPKIGTQPQSVTVAEAFPATFKVGLVGWGNWTTQWKENGVAIPGATGRSYTIAAVTPGQNNKHYSVTAVDSISGQTFNSSDAVLTVVSDTFPPTLVSAATPQTPTPIGTEFNLLYSEPVNKADAENLANYSISGGATLSSATLQTDNVTVHFTTSDLYAPGCKILTVNNVRDRSPTPNRIAANSQIAVLTARGSIRFHRYNGMTGTAITDLTGNSKFPNFPDVVAHPVLFENPEGGGNHGDNYGVQMVGYIHPPVSGAYTFMVASDDNSQLYLSTDENPANKVPIAREPAWANFREWTGNAPGQGGRPCASAAGTLDLACLNVSSPVTLQAGCKYYIEYLLKEGGGGDYGSVNWIPPGAAIPVNGAPPISGTFLSPFDVSPSIPANQPADVSTVQGRIITFTANVVGSPTLTIQWYKNGVAIPNANGTTLTYGPTAYPADNGATFYVTAQNELGTATSRTATLNVTQDLTPPTVLEASASSSFDRVSLKYDEIVDAGTASDGFNYTLTDSGGNALVIAAVTLNADSSSVQIVLDASTPLAQGQVYTLAIANVTDLAGNKIADNTQVPINSFVAGCGGLIFEAYATGGGNAVSDLTGNALFPNSPFVRQVINAADTRAAFPDDSHEGYGGRMRGLYVPPFSGNWVLYLRSDDASELWLNANGPDPAGKQLVAAEGGCCNAFEAHPTAPMALKGGQPYYMEVLYKEGTGGDYAQVAARLAGGSDVLAPITGRDLGAFALPGSAGPLNITEQPADVSTVANTLASFHVTIANPFSLPVCYQWRRNGADIAGANAATYGFGPVTTADNGAVFDCVISIVGANATTRQALLTVNVDTTPPVATSASAGLNLTSVSVAFSEFVDPATAADGFNYAVSGFGVTAAQLNPDGKTVTVTLDGTMAQGTAYQINIQNVSDLSGNTMDPTTLNFTTASPSSGFLVLQVYRPESTTDNNLDTTLLADPNFPSVPNEVRYMSAFDTRTVYPDDSHDGYGGLIFGYFVPPTSGNWIFYLRSDDSSRLYLNPTGTSAAGKVLLTEEAACCGAFSAHASAPQALTAGQKYYIEAIYKEGGGGDYCQVAAKLDTDPGNPDALRPIPGAYLAGNADASGATITITQQPADQVFVVTSGGGGQPLTFSVAATASKTPVAYQWYRDSGSGFAIIPGANGSSFSILPVCGDNGAHFRVSVSIPGASVVSDSAKLTVTQPNTAPSFAVTPPPPVNEDSGAQSVPNTVHDVAAGTAVASTAAPNIAINFAADEAAGSASGTLAASDKAGVVPQLHWNNTTGASGSSSGLIADYANNPVSTLASVTWSSPNTWSSTGRGEENNGFPAGGDHTMMVGYLDTGDALATGLSVTVNGLGSEFTSGGYDVIVYALGGVGGRGGAYTINGTTKYATSPTMPTTHTEDAGAGVADMGTYVRFTGLSGSSFTLTANASSADNPTNTVNFRAPVNGIQIVAHQPSDIPIFSYNANFDSGLPVGTTPSGNTPPAVNAGHLVLTRNGVTSEQNFWTVPLTGVPVLQSLHASWKSLINGPGGADGYSFNFGQNVGTGFTAEEGGNSGLSVTVDTYNNGGNETGIETRWNGARLSFTPIAGGAPNGPPELSKNQFVNATVDVTPSGQVTFNYDGFVTVGQIPSYVGLNANQIVFGARTGGASEDAFIDDLSVAGFAPGACGSESSQTVHFIVSNDNPSIFSAQPAISGNGTLMYTPAANANGVANVSVVAQDDGGALYGGSDTSAQQTFAITINAVNDCPTASGPSGPLTVISGASAAVPITASDIEGDPLSAGIVTPPSHGALSGTGLNVTYTANAGYVGPDSFVLAVTDGQCNSAAIPVSVNVIPIPNPNRPPTCVASIVPPTCTLNVANDGKTYVIALNGGACVLLDSAGSSDPDGDALTVTWTVDNTNHLSGAAVPVCLDLGCHSIEMVVSDGRDVCRKHIDLCVISGGEAIEQVVTLLDGMNLDRKNKRPLIASLKAAVASYDKGDHEHTAANQLNAFQNKCRAQIGRNNPADAAALIKAAQDVVDAVDCAEQVLAAQQGN